MDRRTLIVGASSLGLWAWLPYRAIAGDAKDAFKIFKEIRKAKKKFDEVLAWWDWGGPAAHAIASNQVPPPPPGPCGPEHILPTEQLIAQLQAAAAPSIDFEPPDYSDIDTSSTQATRASLAAKWTAIEQQTEAIEEFRDIALELAAFEGAVQARIFVLRDIEELFLKLATTPATPKMYVDAVSCFSAVGTTYIPTFEQLADVVAARRMEFGAAGDKLVAALANSAKAHINALAAEKLALTIEKDTQAALQKALDSLKSDLFAEKQRLQDVRGLVQNLQTVLEAERGDLENWETTLKESSKLAEGLKKRIAQDKTFRKTAYNLCPNHQPYDDCDHEDKKKEWRRLQDEAQARLDENIPKLQIHEGLIVEAQEQIPLLRKAIEQNEKALAHARDREKAIVAAIDALERKIVEKADELRLRRAENPVEVLLQANEFERLAAERFGA